MLNAIVTAIFMAAWGIAMIVIAVKTGSVPAEMWVVPAAGLGALFAVLPRVGRGPRDEEEKAR